MAVTREQFLEIFYKIFSEDNVNTLLLKVLPYQQTVDNYTWSYDGEYVTVIDTNTAYLFKWTKLCNVGREFYTNIEDDIVVDGYTQPESQLQVLTQLVQGFYETLRDHHLLEDTATVTPMIDSIQQANRNKVVARPYYDLWTETIQNAVTAEATKCNLFLEFKIVITLNDTNGIYIVNFLEINKTFTDVHEALQVIQFILDDYKTAGYKVTSDDLGDVFIHDKYTVRIEWVM